MKNFKISIDKRLSLLDIIKSIQNIHKYKWKILFLGDTFTNYEKQELSGGILDVLEFETLVNDSSSGYEVSLPDLIIINEWVYQFVDLILIGDVDYSKLKKYESDEEMKRSCNVIIEMVDSSYWEITCSEDTIILIPK